ncbi:YdcF family protein [Martelella soudanensis]|uniref:YdcF family protein n=1 Tax=unclassified Martelella TaxID=2629616 RepID=UPI0015DFB4CC|nr:MULTISPECIES: YdcF family protein [unclassified Martelella]
MFVVSKLFWMICQPLALAFLTMLVALVCLVFSRSDAAAAFAALAVVTLGIACFTNIGTMLMAGLENRFARPALETPPALAIVLGGGISTDISARRGTYVFSRAADRYIEALRLARLYPQMKILVTGGDNALSGNINGEAAPAARFFADHGIAGERLIYEPRARNTAENASLTAALLEKHDLGDARCLLITSAYHMPRSVEQFRRQRMEVTPWPADYRTDGNVRFAFSHDKPMVNAAMLSTALREWAGLALSRRPAKTAGPATGT